MNLRHKFSYSDSLINQFVFVIVSFDGEDVNNATEPRKLRIESFTSSQIYALRMQALFDSLFYDDDNLYPKYSLATMKYILRKEEARLKELDSKELVEQLEQNSHFGLSHDGVHITPADLLSYSSYSSKKRDHHVICESRFLEQYQFHLDSLLNTNHHPEKYHYLNSNQNLESVDHDIMSDKSGASKVLNLENMNRMNRSYRNSTISRKVSSNGSIKPIKDSDNANDYFNESHQYNPSIDHAFGASDGIDSFEKINALHDESSITVSSLSDTHSDDLSRYSALDRNHMKLHKNAFKKPSIGMNDRTREVNDPKTRNGGVNIRRSSLPSTSTSKRKKQFIFK